LSPSVGLSEEPRCFGFAPARDTRTSAAVSRPCYIHVGTHKTGTTSIQAFLRDNEQRFAAQGVMIPRRGRGEDAAGHHNLSQELLAGGGFVAKRGGLDDVSAELRRSTKRRACISSEDFSLVWHRPEALIRLRNAIDATGFTPVIIVYLRPQISYCTSTYAEIVKNAIRKPFGAFLRDINEHGAFVWNGGIGPLCRYDVLLERFATIFGEHAMIVRRYHSIAPKNALLRSFAQLLIGRDADLSAFTFPPERFNPSLSFARVLHALGSDVAMTDMRFAPLDLRETLELAASFYAPNRAVARRYGVWVPPCDVTDLLLSLPVRRTYARTASLAKARRALRESVPVLHDEQDLA
jgi:hypothetical protein